MNISDLIGIGRLGGSDSNGFFQVLVKPRYRELLTGLKEVFLIFNSDRVFFVTICDRDLNDRKFKVRFAEDGVFEERRRHKEVILAVPTMTENNEDDPEYILGFSVIYQEREIGKISDYFHNNAQYVLVIEQPDQQELMVPMVPHFIADILPSAKAILMINLDELIED
jgi:ribosomal 30S subunit maturation factor RimM